MLAQAANDFVGPPIDWWGVTPLLVLLGGGLLLLVAAALTPHWPRGWYALATVTTASAALVLSIFIWDDISDGGDRFLIAESLRIDRFTMFITITICAAVALAALLTDDFLRREGAEGPEVYGLYLMCAIGGVVMAAANDLVVLFLGLETLSIALYVLAASNRKRAESQESGLKYFILGSFSSAFLLYGIALVYGATGTTHLTSSPAGELSIFSALESTVFLGNTKTLLLAGIALLLVGLSFKIAAVPFHTWTPDVYQGAPTPVTAFMASAAKVAGFAALLRVLTYGLSSRVDDWRPVIWVIAVITLVVGSTLAVIQTNVKRMLAYSSISHAGFILVGVEAANERGVSGSLFYLLTYGVLVLGTFGVVTLVGRTGDAAHDLDSYRGFGRQRPILAFALTVFLLAQAGVPLTSGFVAKFAVIAAAADADSFVLAVIAMLSAVIAAFLYLRIIVSMFLADPETVDAGREPVRIPVSAGLAIAIAFGFTLLVGFWPGWLLDLAEDAVPRLGLAG
ncbi:MAG: NADH-quinone oxidoreductase subunit N [Acidimicrobiia bacterium]